MNAYRFPLFDACPLCKPMSSHPAIRFAAALDCEDDPAVAELLTVTASTSRGRANYTVRRPSSPHIETQGPGPDQIFTRRVRDANRIDPKEGMAIVTFIDRLEHNGRNIPIPANRQ